MINFIILTIVIILCYFIFYFKKSNTNKWMDKEFTICIKGFAILTVIWAHVGKNYNVPSIQFIAGVGVSLFLICSGYGLEYSYQRNKLNDFWKKRVKKVYIPFTIATLFSTIVFEDIFIKDLLDSLLLVKANWYLRFLLLQYLIFYFIKYIKLKKCITDKSENILILLMSILVLAIYSFVFVTPDAPSLKARQAISFALGIFIAKYYNKICNLLDIRKNNVIIIFITGIIGLITMAVSQFSTIKSLPYIIYNIISIFTCFPLAITVLTIGYIFPKGINNGVFCFLGKYSYELFLLHIYLLRILNNSIKSIIYYASLTIILSILLNILTKLMFEKRKSN